MDNASSNDTLARKLATLLTKYGSEFEVKDGQIRCLPHVINLVVQKILSVLCDAQGSHDVANPDVEDYFPLSKHLPIHYDPTTDADLANLEAEYDEDLRKEAAQSEGSPKADEEGGSDDFVLDENDQEEDDRNVKDKSPVFKVCANGPSGDRDD